jgi:hypothetical protein
MRSSTLACPTDILHEAVLLLSQVSAIFRHVCFCKFWHFHCDSCSDLGLLHFHAVYICRRILPLRRNVVSSSLRLTWLGFYRLCREVARKVVTGQFPHPMHFNPKDGGSVFRRKSTSVYKTKQSCNQEHNNLKMYFYVFLYLETKQWNRLYS